MPKTPVIELAHNERSAETTCCAGREENGDLAIAGARRLSECRQRRSEDAESKPENYVRNEIERDRAIPPQPADGQIAPIGYSRDTPSAIAA